MANLPALITLKDIVEEFRLKSKLPKIEYANLKQIAIRGYQRLVFLIIPQGRVVEKYTMDSNKILALPDDLVELNAVYVPDAYGEFWPLSKNNNMVSTVSAGPTRNPDSPHYEGVDTPDPGGRYYSATGGVNLVGYYIIDWPNRRILFTNIDQSEVVLDYLSTGVDDLETAYVPTQATEAIHAYMAFQYYSFQPKVPTNKIELYRDILKGEEKKLKGMKFNFEDFKQHILRNLSPSILR